MMVMLVARYVRSFFKITPTRRSDGIQRGRFEGRAIIEQELYESEAYRDARHDRSAAESCVYALKQMHDYGDVMRRGLEAVRHEQMSKVLAYNVRRMVRLEEDAANAGRKVLWKNSGRVWSERRRRQSDSSVLLPRWRMAGGLCPGGTDFAKNMEHVA